MAGLQFVIPSCTRARVRGMTSWRHCICPKSPVQVTRFAPEKSVRFSLLLTVVSRCGRSLESHPACERRICQPRALICGLQSSENIWWQSCRCPTRFYRDFKPPLLFLTVAVCCSACKRKHLLFLRRLKLCCETHTCARSLGKTRGLGKANWATLVLTPEICSKQCSSCGFLPLTNALTLSLELLCVYATYFLVNCTTTHSICNTPGALRGVTPAPLHPNL